MQTLQLTNEKIRLGRKTRLALLVICLLIIAYATRYASSTRGAVAIIALGLLLFFGLRYVYQRGVIRYTLTKTHLQQHTYKGGWVVQWQSIQAIGLCESRDSLQNTPLPWIGIRIKDPVPFIDSICPRVTTDILLEQRALLYLGAREQEEEDDFQDKVLDNRPVKLNESRELSGLQASLYHRMQHQRHYWGYDIFISTSDLDREAEDFIGLLRRYWAASASEQNTG